MNTETILRLLKNSGFHIIGADSASVYIEDPSCILRSFEKFTEYAWIIISCLSAFLLIGWAISMIRGAKNDISRNIVNLLIMFGTLSVAVPIINMIWGDDLFARGCRTITVPIDEVNKMLEARNLKMSKVGGDLYEEFDIYDSGPNYYDDLNDMTVPETGVSVGGNEGASENPTSEPNSVNTQPTSPVASTGTPVSATGSGNDVIYTFANGAKTRNTGGSRAWRNTNPGNIRFSEFSRRMGAIGQAGGFAVFPTETVGSAAIAALLRSDSYKNLTIADAISRYAPPFENDTAAYHRSLAKKTGLNINMRINALTDSQLAMVVNAIRDIEGWKVGRTVKI